MTRSILIAAGLLTLSFLPSPSRADVVVSDPVSFQTSKGLSVGIALMSFKSDTDDALTGASSPVCDHVEIHQMSEDHGLMKMRKVDFVALPAGQPVELNSSGYHLMLMKLKAPLEAGTSFPLRLTFGKAAPQTVTVTIGTRHRASPHD